MRYFHLAPLAAGALLAASFPAVAQSPFGSSSYTSSLSLPNGAGIYTPMPIAYSNGYYYGTSGASGDAPEQMYSSNGALLASQSPNPGIDFRSIFTNAAGQVFVRGFGDNEIYEQTSFANFTPYLSLQGSLNGQEQVVYDPSTGLYFGNNSGTAQEWNATGQLIASFALQGISNSSLYEQDETLAVFHGTLVNYDNGVLSAYSETTGQLLGSTDLVGAGTDDNAYYSSGYANGYFFVYNGGLNEYQGYLLANEIPEPGSIAAFGVGLLALGATIRRRSTGAAR